MNRFILSIACVLGAVSAHAQFQGNVFVEDSSIKVFNGGMQRQLAWCGGFNNPQFAMGDLNNDGKKDMVIFEWGTNQMKTYLNVGTTSNAVYQYAPKYVNNFPIHVIPGITDYLKLEDYNRDNVPDLFTKGLGGFNVYRGYYNASNELCFTYYKDLRYRSTINGVPQQGPTINCYSQASDIPAIVDIDNDGDLDFFGYNEDGAIIYFFKNCQVENGSPKDSIDICKPSNCWGAINQGFIRAFTLGIVTGGNACKPYNTYSCKGTLHSGNTLCILDIDGDGDYDLLDGNISYSDLQFLRNGKAQYGGIDSMISQDTLWQTGGVPVNMSYWPSAFYVDANGDGKKDILVTPHLVATSENYKCVAYYKNTGTATSPVFTYQNDTFMVDQSIDVGYSSYPVLYDYNKDGRLDMFVGSAGYFQSNGTFRSKISYFQNKLVGGTTTLEFMTDNFQNIFGEGIEGAIPAFGDIDDDGKDDMVIGHVDGTLSFYKNTAASASVQPVFQPAIPLKDQNGAIIIASPNAAPFIYDITRDGKPDLLIAGQNGRVKLFKNMSTAGTTSLQFVTDTLGGMKAEGNNFSTGSLYIGKMDNTGKDYIVMGNDAGNIRRYYGFASGNVNMQYQLLDTMYANIDLGTRSAPAFGDINLDGKYEMIGGNYLGGLEQYKQAIIVPNLGVGNVAQTGECSVYPNPASDAIYMIWDASFAANDPVNIQLINMTGQTVLKTTYAPQQLAGKLVTSTLAPGIYICVVQAGDHLHTQRIVIRK